MPDMTGGAVKLITGLVIAAGATATGAVPSHHSAGTAHPRRAQRLTTSPRDVTADGPVTISRGAGERSSAGPSTAASHPASRTPATR